MIRIVLRKSALTKTQNVCRSGGQDRLVHSSNNLQFQEAGFKLFLLAPVLAGAGVAAYAKYDDKFRKAIVAQVPAIDPVLKVLFQEQGNALEEATKSVNNAKQKVNDFTGKIGDMTSSVTSMFGGGTSKPDESKIPTKSSEKSKASSAIESPPLPKISPPPSSSSSTTKSATAPAKLHQQASTAAAATATGGDVAKKQVDSVLKSAALSLPTNIVELENAVEAAAQLAANEYQNAIKILKSYNEEVKNIIDESADKIDISAWSKLRNKTTARDAAVSAAEATAQKARATIDNLERSIQKIAKDSSPEIIEVTGNKIRSYSDHLNKVKDEMYEAKDLAKTSEKFWKNVEVARNYFVDEIEALFPSIKFDEKKLQLKKEELELFMVYVYSHVLAYKKELAKLELEGNNRIRRVIDSIRSENPTESVNAQVEFEIEKERQRLSLENQKKIFTIRAEKETEIREYMKRQSEAHVDHLEDALKQKENEMKRLFNRELGEKLSSEQTAYKEKIASMLGRLKGMDDALKARADADRMVHQAQSLWSACQALWASVRCGEPGVSWQEKLRPLGSEVAAVSSAAQGDELVAVVLQGVPAMARTRGVYPEDALRERFIKVERLARRLALVPAGGSGLPMYLLSYLQSMFILTPDNPISKEELNNEPIDFNSLDTYDILNRAKYWMERGDLLNTLKYMNLLKGAPRQISKDWLNEARLLLETQQATNVLMSHAATSGLSFL